jgi:hypothetical protein
LSFPKSARRVDLENFSKPCHPPPLRNLPQFRIHQPVREKVENMLRPPKSTFQKGPLSPWERARVRVPSLSPWERARERVAPLSLWERVRVRERVPARTNHRIINHLQHCFCFVQHLVVPETENPNSLLF